MHGPKKNDLRMLISFLPLLYAREINVWLQRAGGDALFSENEGWHENNAGGESQALRQPWKVRVSSTDFRVE